MRVQLYSWEGMWIGVPLSALGHKVDLCYDHAQLRVLSGYSGRIAAL